MKIWRRSQFIRHTIEIMMVCVFSVCGTKIQLRLRFNWITYCQHWLKKTKKKTILQIYVLLQNKNWYHWLDGTMLLLLMINVACCCCCDCSSWIVNAEVDGNDVELKRSEPFVYTTASLRNLIQTVPWAHLNGSCKASSDTETLATETVMSMCARMWECVLAVSVYVYGCLPTRLVAQA